MFSLRCINKTLAFFVIILSIGYSNASIEDAIKNGFRYLGSGMNIHAKSTKSISYLLSPDQLTQSKARSECDLYGGSLLNILNKAQDEEIRALLDDIQIVEPFGRPENFAWTSGRFDSFNNRWTWNSINRPIVYFNFNGGSPNTDELDNNQGIAVGGSMSSYGWYVWPIGVPLKYICQF